MWVFNKKDVELKPSFANLLKCLSIYDILLLVGRHIFNFINGLKIMRRIYIFCIRLIQYLLYMGG